MSKLRLSVALRAALVVLALVLLHPPLAHAYIGPGAGFAFVSSFFILIITFLLAFLTLLTWPIRWIFQTIRGRRALKRSRVKKVIVLGLDGQDPDLTRKFMAEGLLPNFAKLQSEGSFVNLETTLLAESPVAWSSFQTGCNPGRHHIYDFLVPNRKSYLPELSSAQISTTGRVLRLGPWQIPLGKPLIRLGRKSQPFWKSLGDHGVFSTILRVPITFPPEKFRGLLLSAMCAPDLQGSQGTYFYFSTDASEERHLTSGMRVPMELNGATAKSYLPGPENSMRREGGEMRLPFEVRVKDDDTATLIVGKKKIPLRRREYTPWISLEFRPGLNVKVRGIAKFYLLETKPHVKLFVTPINIDPDKPALPISHPFTYAIYLAKTQGLYATLGVAEDTSALNEDIIDEQAFLDQAYMIHEEREKMYFDALEKTRRGCVVCVFDLTDRVQHMFFRHLDEDHPANRGKDNETHKNAIRKLYEDMDDLVGRTLAKMDDDTVLFVMSDHGFKPFKRGVNLNTWLWRNGYMTLKSEAPTGADMFQDVDWEKTRAYAVGFGGIYLNLRGREGRGIVEPGEEAAKLKAEIASRLRELTDEQSENANPVRHVYTAEEAFSGPYVHDAPDLIAGFRPGWRVSWSCVTGGLTSEIIEDNTRYWSGDHNFNPPDVPGMLFVNRKLPVDRASITDLAPTVLDLFGVPIPPWIDGRSIMPAGNETEQKSVPEDRQEVVA